MKLQTRKEVEIMIVFIKLMQHEMGRKNYFGIK